MDTAAPKYVVGFTGTRRGMTLKQRAAVRAHLGSKVFCPPGTACEFHHGDCVGADFEAHAAAAALGYRTVAHPPMDPALRAFVEADDTMPRAPYLVRNRDIVAAATVMLAAPWQTYVPPQPAYGGGTWYTVRHALAQGKRVVVVWPNGTHWVLEKPEDCDARSHDRTIGPSRGGLRGVGPVARRPA